MQKEDILLPSSQQILQLPEGFTIGKAIGGGDCFFDAIAQGLKQLKPGTNFTVKSLREVCRKQALSSQEMKKKIIADARNRGDSNVVFSLSCKIESFNNSFRTNFTSVVPFSLKR